MKATHEDLSGLIRLQQTDLDALKQKKALDELPQRKTILNARQKRAVVEEKLARVAELRKGSRVAAYAHRGGGRFACGEGGRRAGGHS